MQGRGWTYALEEGWAESSSIMLSFDNMPLHGSVNFERASSSEALDEALTLPTGSLHADCEPLTGDQLAGIGERAVGFTVMRVVHAQHPRGTRRQDWTFSQISFARCGTVVHVVGEFDADHGVSIARELDGWLAKQACC